VGMEKKQESEIAGAYQDQKAPPQRQRIRPNQPIDLHRSLHA
jgi:hypothetical protein